MKRTVITAGVLMATLLLTLLTAAQGTSSPQKSDAEIQKCIQESIAKSPSLKEQSLSVSVSQGTATITGKAKNSGSKGAATRMAKKCGAKEVKNEAAVENTARPKAKAADAPKNQ